MTISYSGNFARLLVRWKGSIWKTVWKELLVFLISYYTVRIFYRFVMDDESRHVFERLVREFDEYTTRVPLTFLLGFYVNAVVKRWWEQFTYVAWPDDLLSQLCYVIPGADEDSLQRRRLVARYVNLTGALTYREISIKVRKRFPTLEHLIAAGLITDDELLLYYRTPINVRWMMPLHWAQHIVKEYCDKYKVPAPLVVQWLSLLYAYRNAFRELHCYDWVCIPLVYTQVAAIATYGYFFMLCLIGRQFLLTTAENGECLVNGTTAWTNGSTPAYNVSSKCTVYYTTQPCNPTESETADAGGGSTPMMQQAFAGGAHGMGILINHYSNISSSLSVDYIVPIFTILEFLFYIGWFKVGQDLMRPFEEDDDDFELNYILDRNMNVSTALVNSVHAHRPAAKSHPMWTGNDISINDTKISCKQQYHPPKLHAVIKTLKPGDTDFVAEPLLQRQIEQKKQTVRYF